MYKLLIVEDEEIIRKGLVHTIDWLSMGFTVIADGSNGAEGLELIKEHHPDLIITDIRMPILNGLEMLKQAKEINSFESLILTSYEEFEYAKEAISIGVNEYILKPIDESKLCDAVEKIRITLNEKEIVKEVKKRTKSKNQLDFAHIDLYVDENNLNYYVQKCLQKIKEKYYEKISIEDVAEELGVSTSYLSRKFKSETAHTFLDMLNKYRVGKAIEEISNNKDRMRIYEIAERVGFTDYKHFCLVFKKYTKMSPTSFSKSKTVFTLGTNYFPKN